MMQQCSRFTFKYQVGLLYMCILNTSK